MRKTNLIIYWLILIIATIMIGSVSYWLLDNEQKQINFFTDDLARARANTVINNINNIVTQHKRNIMESLKRIPPWDVYEMLPLMKEENILVDEIVYWIPEHGIVLPDTVTRYDEALKSLFNEGSFEVSELLWQLPNNIKTRENDPQIRRRVIINNNTPDHLGWFPIHAEGKFHLMGWFRTTEGGSIRAVILDMDVLADKLDPAFPEKLMLGEYMSIENDKQTVMREDGTLTIGEPQKIFIGNNLPNWSLSYNYTKRNLFAKGFYTLGTFLIFVLVIAIVLGGSLLLRQAQIKSTEAAMKTTFVSNVSHELKTPLTSIRLYSEMLGKGKIHDPKKQKGYLETIIFESERLTRLVNNILDFSRLEQGKKQYHSAITDICETVKHITEMQRLRVEDAGMQLEYDIPDKSINHKIDTDALEQVLINLIDNALKYATSGKYIKISIEESYNKISIIVRDRGPGIPTDHQNQIFEMFHRVDDSLTSNQPGCGLGLSISKKLVEDMGGKLSLRYDTNQKQGACFVISFNTNV